MRARGRLAATIALGAACAMAAGSLARDAHAQAYARFRVPDAGLAAALGERDYEGAWNVLLVTALRAEVARHDSAATLLALAQRVAAAETTVLGSRIGPDALTLRGRWSDVGKTSRIRAAVMESLATVAQGARDYEGADSLLRVALADYRRLGEKRRTAWVLGSQGVVAFLAGDYEASLDRYREALEARRAIGDPRMLGNTLNSLGTTSYLLGRDDDAYAYFQQARATRERTGELAALGSTLNYLGLTAVRRGQPDSAEVWYARALGLTVSQGDSARTSEVLINWALLLDQRGEGARALAFNERALAIARERGDARAESRLALNLGAQLGRQGRYRAAADRLGEAIALALEARDVRQLLEARIERGRMWTELEEPAAARADLEPARALADSLDDPGARVRALNQLALVARAEGDASAAAALAREALGHAEGAGDSARVHVVAVTIGQIAGDRQDWAAAARWFARALAADSSAGASQRAADLVNLGSAEGRTGRHDAARARLNEALALAQRGDDPVVASSALLGLGDVAELEGAMDEALAFYRRAAMRLDTLRLRAGGEAQAIPVLAASRFAFEALIHLLQKLAPSRPGAGLEAEAFAWAERARARSLLDVLAAGRAEARTITLADARRALPADDAALLEYSVGDSSSSLWIVTREGSRLVALPPRAALRARIEILRRGLADPASASSRSTRAAARSLYRTLVEPAESELAGMRHVIVSPDGPLSRVPFEALLTRDVEGDAVAPAGSHLVERWSVTYVPSASALAFAAAGPRPREGNRGAVLALGNPAFGTEPTALGRALAPLPNTALEVEALRALANKRPFTGLVGPAATRGGLLAGGTLARARIVHLATHGEADESAPERTGLWLAPDTTGAPPAFLPAADVLALDLEAALVTLSACETGLGRVSRGEGVLGLARAFLAAGARSVVMSLWEVNDRSTAELMRRFYQPLLAKGMPREQALAEAKRALLARDETRSPFHWAAFVLVGESGALK
jgi:CHAT domain-containing protein/Tfp pilus assembly protein PilF